MAEYAHADDGKLHTRYSELVRCGPQGVVRVAEERLGLVEPFDMGDQMGFGRTRHEMWEEESRRTGRTPDCFQEIGIDLPVESIEQEWTMELMPGIILHSRTDATSFANRAVIDNKSTQVGSAVFAKKEQLLVYALQLMQAGHRIDKGIILAEIWDENRDEVLRYESTTRPLPLGEIVAVKHWLKSRAERLQVAIEILTKNIDKHGNI